MEPFSKYGLAVIFAVLMVILFLSFKKDELKVAQPTFLVLVFDLIFVQITYSLLKIIIHRDRPFLNPNYLITAIYEADGFSFPSGHTSTAFALVLPFIFLLSNKTVLLKIMKIFLLIFAIVMAYSRMFLGVHYLSDILAGTGLGILFLGISVVLTNKIFSSGKITWEKLQKIMKIVLIIGIFALIPFVIFGST
jgi:undecaprenyl-diphosphatase